MKTLIAIAIFSFALNTSAQTVTATVEERSSYIQHKWKLNWAEKNGFEDESGIIQVEVSGRRAAVFPLQNKLDFVTHSLVIRRVDASENVLKVNKLEGGERVFGPLQSEPVEFNDKLLIFYSKYQNETIELFVSEINRASLELQKTQSLHKYYQKNTLVGIATSRLVEGIAMCKSSDGSNLLVSLPTFNDGIFTAVLDKDLNVVNSRATKVEGSAKWSVHAPAVIAGGTSAVFLSDYNFIKSSSPTQWTAKRLVLMSPGGIEKIVDLEMGNSTSQLTNPSVCTSNDNSKFLVVGDYLGEVGWAGIWMMEVDAKTLKAGKIQRYPYPEEYMKNIHKIGFGFKKRGMLGVQGTEYKLVQLPDGSLAAGGSARYLYDTEGLYEGKITGRRIHFDGPILMCFIQNKKPTFTHIPRHQNSSTGSAPIFYPYQDKVVVIYNDYKKNINGELKPDKVYQEGGVIPKEVSLAYAIVGRNGEVQKREVLADGISRKNHFNTYRHTFLSNNKLLLPSETLDKKTKESAVALVTIQ
jgi:hypothetical protein